MLKVLSSLNIMHSLPQISVINLQSVSKLNILTLICINFITANLLFHKISKYSVYTYDKLIGPVCEVK